jgi:hypothetical protein
VPVQEQEGAERLHLGRRRHPALDGQVGEERLDLGGPQLDRVPRAVEQDEPAGPVYIRVLGAEGVIPDPEGRPHLVQQAGPAGGRVGLGPSDGDLTQIAVEEVAVQEVEGPAGLGQTGQGLVPLGGQVGEEGPDLGRGHLVRVAEAVEADERLGPPGPGGGLGAGDPTDVQGGPEAVEELGRAGRRDGGR